MRRRALVAVLLGAPALAAGCGGSQGGSQPGVVQQPDAGKGPVSRAPVAATRGCGSMTASDSRAYATPPVPLIRARRVADGFEVDWELLAFPNECKPAAIAILAASVDRNDNKGLPVDGDAGSRIAIDDRAGTARLRDPPLDLPPYEVFAATYTAEGMASETTSVPVPDDSDYCRRHMPAKACYLEAQAKFERCLRGDAPRAECASWIWNTRPRIRPYPTRGITRAELERSFAFMAHRGDTGSYALVSVHCPTTSSCVADWRGGWGYTKMRFLVAGDRYRAGCWIAERRAVLIDSPPLNADGHTVSDLMTDRYSGCVD